MHRMLAAFASIGGLLLLLTPPAAAQVQPTAQLRVAHLSPDTPGVDVYLDGQKAVGNMGFETVTDYLAVPSGEHLLELRAAGAAPESPAVISATQQLEAGRAYTAAGIGPRSELRAAVFQDSLDPPAPGQAGVRVIHAAVEAPPVNVSLGEGAAEFTNATFGNATPYQPVPPGRYDVALTDTSGNELLPPASVEFAQGVNYTLAAIGGGDAPLRVLPIADTRAAAAVPVGGMATGAGGMAPRPASPQTRFGVGVQVAAGALVLVVLVVLVAAVAFRRPVRVRVG